jgi:hypothetical protein
MATDTQSTKPPMVRAKRVLAESWNAEGVAKAQSTSFLSSTGGSASPPSFASAARASSISMNPFDDQIELQGQACAADTLCKVALAIGWRKPRRSLAAGLGYGGHFD